MNPQAQVQTFFAFPAGGVRGYISMFIAAYFEKLSGVPIFHLSDINAGDSIGMIAAAAYSRAEAADSLVGKDVLDDAFVTLYRMFNRDTKDIAIKNALKALPLAEAHAPRAMRHLLKLAKGYAPAPEDGKYDTSALELVLRQSFQNKRIKDLAKPFFAAAHCISDGLPHIFTNVDVRRLPTPDHASYNLLNVPTHGDVDIVDAIMAGTAIPGFIDYRHIDGLGRFMDAGSFAAQNFYGVMRDMDIAANEQIKLRHAETLSARNIFQRVTRKAPPAPSVVSRVVYFGVGDETALDFNVDSRHGAFPQFPDIIAALSNHGRHGTFNQIRARFDKASMKVTGKPALRIIDANIVPKTDAERDAFPSSGVTDGSLDNLLKLSAFAKSIVMQHGSLIADELKLRIEELKNRGTFTEDEAVEALRRIDRGYDPDAVSELCDMIMHRRDDALDLLVQRGVPVTGGLKAEPSSATGGWRIPFPALRWTTTAPKTA